MYQSREEDINEKALKFKSEIERLEKDYKYVDELLERVYGPVTKIQLVKKNGSAISFEFLFHWKNNKTVSQRTALNLDDTITSITKGTVNAIITFLEGHRELIIQEINNLTKENFKS